MTPASSSSPCRPPSTSLVFQQVSTRGRVGLIQNRHGVSTSATFHNFPCIINTYLKCNIHPDFVHFIHSYFVHFIHPYFVHFIHLYFVHYLQTWGDYISNVNYIIITVRHINKWLKLYFCISCDYSSMY